ncbi:MAG TPA: hypothetical protein VE987_13575 [Polyangiaceae bacterium]|nr:hypothetical protein [Polyangiaceae bacterium]
MASIEITREELVVHIRGWHKVLAMRGTLRIPVSHVRAARARPREANFDDETPEEAVRRIEQVLGARVSAHSDG